MKWHSAYCFQVKGHQIGRIKDMLKIVSSRIMNAINIEWSWPTFYHRWPIRTIMFLLFSYLMDFLVWCLTSRYGFIWALLVRQQTTTCSFLSDKIKCNLSTKEEYKNPSWVSMQNREISPEGEEPGTRLAKFLVKIPTPRVKYLYPAWTGSWCITETRLFKFIEKFTSKNWRFSDKNSNIFIFLLKTKIVSTR